MATLLRRDANRSNFPTAIQASLASVALVARYDPSGRYIAAGQYNGTAVVWDLETRSIIRSLDGHVRPVSSVDWSRSSRYLLTTSRDWNMIVWDLKSNIEPPQRTATIRFDSPVFSGYFHPYNSKISLALLSNGEAFLMDRRQNQTYRTELWENVEEPSPITVVRFHPDGKLVFVGTATGHVLVFNTRTKKMIARHRISGAHSMKHLEFSKNGRYLLTNSTDRTIRQLLIPPYTYVLSDEDSYVEQELESLFRYNDPINRVSWNGVSLSPDGHWVAGGAGDAMGHKIYIWDVTADGRFAATLDGGREALSGLQWHPVWSMLASVTRDGSILLWHVPTQEHFAAFAGGFEEIEENVIYEEREDEFDIEDEDAIAERKRAEEEADVDVDSVSDTEVEKRLKEFSRATKPTDDEELKWAVEEKGEDEDGQTLEIAAL